MVNHEFFVTGTKAFILMKFVVYGRINLMNEDHYHRGNFFKLELIVRDKYVL
jgi:hypothetical protein